MLRITVHDNAQALTFQLEGALAGPWVRELEECWQSTRARRREPTVCVDLQGVTFIGAAGVACLAAMHRQGSNSSPPTASRKPSWPRLPRRRFPTVGARRAKAKARRNGPQVQHQDHRDSSHLPDLSCLVSRLAGCPIVNLRVHRLVLVLLGG